MYSALKRAVQRLHKNAPYRTSQCSRRLVDHQQLSHRQFSTFYAEGSLRRRHNPHSLTVLRHIHFRAISYSSIPRFVVHGFWITIICVGVCSYAEYKFEKLKKQIIDTARETAQIIVGSTLNRLKVVFDRVRAVEHPHREVSQFLKNLVNATKRQDQEEGSNDGDFTGSNKRSLKDNAAATAQRVLESASDRLKPVSDRVPAVDLEALKSIVISVKRQDHDEASSDKRSRKDNAVAIAQRILKSASDRLKPVSDVEPPHLETPHEGSGDQRAPKGDGATMPSSSNSPKSEMMEGPSGSGGESDSQQNKGIDRK